MTIKHLGGIFGRNPTFNDVTIEDGIATDNISSASGGNITCTNSLQFPDGQNLFLGTGSHLRIRHTGAASEISDEGAGELYLRSYGGGIYFQTGGVNNRAWFDNTGNLNFNAGLGLDFSATSSGMVWRTGTGTPEGSVTASVGSLYTRSDGGASTTLYVKESGTGNTGWVAK